MKVLTYKGHSVEVVTGIASWLLDGEQYKGVL